MPSLSRRWGIVYAAAGAAGLIVACSTTPHFVNDLTGGSGGSAATTTSATTGTGGASTSTSTTTTTAATTTTATTSTTTSSSGGGPACDVVGDCGMVATACATPTCTNGQCGVANTMAGTPTAAQIPGDCLQIQCDGMGGVMTVPDDSDVPDDGNACVIPGCSNGTPTQSNAAPDTLCGLAGELTCDGNGVCAGCASAVQCGNHMGMGGTTCVTWTCETSRCMSNPTPKGEGSPGGDAPGDCQKNACDGMGGVESIADPTDVPASPSACVIGACVNGVPTAQPAPSTTTCIGGHTCDGAGHCGSCATTADCGTQTVCGTPACFEGYCTGTFAPTGPAQQQVAGDCKTAICNGLGGVTQQADTSDTPPAGGPCLVGACSGEVPEMEPAANGTSCGTCSECEAGACTVVVCDAG